MLDIASLLQPISEENPVGEDLKASGDTQYALLKDYRIAASQQERDALYDENSPRDMQYWHKIAALAPTLLQERSKDLNLVVWLVEALVRLEGFEGLATGLTLLTEMLQQFWPDIYPKEDEEGLTTKIMPLISLNGQQSEGTLIAPIYSITLIKNQEHDIAGWQYKQALNYSKITDIEKLKLLQKRGILTLETIKGIVSQTPISYLTEKQQAIQHCLEQLNALKAILNEYCGNEAPPASNIQQALQFCLESVQAFLKTKQVNQPVVTNADKTSADNTDEKNNQTQIDYTSIHSKEQALTILLEIANYFRSHEPQSPVPYLLEQAINWSRLSLPELLGEIIPNPDILNYSLRLIGSGNAINNFSQPYAEPTHYEANNYEQQNA